MSILTIILFIFSGAVILLMVVPRIIMTVKAAKLKGQKAPTLFKPSEKRILAGKKTILYFYTPSCAACKMQDPILKKVQEEHGDAIFKIDATQHSAAAAAYGVMGVPFFAFVEKGLIYSARAGVQLESGLCTFLQN